MKKIILFKGAKVMIDDLEDRGFTITTNTGPVIDIIEATAANKKKHFPNMKEGLDKKIKV